MASGAGYRKWPWPGLETAAPADLQRPRPASGPSRAGPLLCLAFVSGAGRSCKAEIDTVVLMTLCTCIRLELEHGQGA